MTLAETIIVAALLLAVLGVVASVFQFGSRSTEASKEKTDLMVANSTLADRLRTAVVSSARSGNTFSYPGGHSPATDLAMSVVSTRDTTGAPGWDNSTGRPSYQSYSVFYLDTAAQTIREFSEPFTPTTVPTPMSVTNLHSSILSSSAKDRVKDVVEFVLYDPVDNSVSLTPTNPLGIRWVSVNQRGAPHTTQFAVKIPSI